MSSSRERLILELYQRLPWQVRIGLRAPITDPSRLLEFRQEDRIISANNMPSSESFQLLDLPREVRDSIYREMLCDWRKGADHLLWFDTVQLTPMRREIKPNILLVNKQIYQEAKLVLIKENQFIHVRMDVRTRDVITAIFFSFDVPVVAASRIMARSTAAITEMRAERRAERRRSGYRECAAVFKNLVVMTHFIDFASYSRSRFDRVERFDVILLHRDLRQFCKGLVFLDSLGPYASYSKHRLTIHNPFEKTLSPDFLNDKNQARLLEPYSKDFQGFDHFEIDGHVQPDLRQTMVAKILEEHVVPDPDTFLGNLRRQKELGDQAFDAGDREGAEEYWKSVHCLFLMSMNRKMWPRVKEARGEDFAKDFAHNVAELVFLTESNRMEGCIVALRGIPLQMQISESRSMLGYTVEEAKKVDNLRRRFEVLAQRFQKALANARNIGLRLRTDCTATNEQQAEFHYRRAQGLRLIGANSYMYNPETNVNRAEQSINRAAELLPDDAGIQSEAQQIQVWKARVRASLLRRRFR